MLYPLAILFLLLGVVSSSLLAPSERQNVYLFIQRCHPSACENRHLGMENMYHDDEWKILLHSFASHQNLNHTIDVAILMTRIPRVVGVIHTTRSGVEWNWKPSCFEKPQISLGRAADFRQSLCNLCSWYEVMNLIAVFCSRSSTDCTHRLVNLPDTLSETWDNLQILHNELVQPFRLDVETIGWILIGSFIGFAVVLLCNSDKLLEIHERNMQEIYAAEARQERVKFLLAKKRALERELQCPV
ncbi:hypothetical protein P9112_010698 [Eukaryota sp. TZLM1-RC]